MKRARSSAETTNSIPNNLDAGVETVEPALGHGGGNVPATQSMLVNLFGHSASRE